MNMVVMAVNPIVVISAVDSHINSTTCDNEDAQV